MLPKPTQIIVFANNGWWLPKIQNLTKYKVRVKLILELGLSVRVSVNFSVRVGVNFSVKVKFLLTMADGCLKSKIWPNI